MAEKRYRNLASTKLDNETQQEVVTAATMYNTTVSAILRDGVKIYARELIVKRAVVTAAQQG